MTLELPNGVAVITVEQILEQKVFVAIGRIGVILDIFANESHGPIT
jgi:hypothetical protein